MARLSAKKIIIAVVAGALVALVFASRVQLKNFVQDLSRPELPAPKSAAEFQDFSPMAAKPPARILAKTLPHKLALKSTKAPPQPASPPAAIAADLPAEINLDIPFASQAPFGNWEMPYQEACEEAAVIMAHYYLTGATLSAEKMNEEILKLVEWEKKTFGFYEDTNGAETARMLTEYFGDADVEVRYGADVTIENIKREVAAGHPVILLAAGRLLPNPNFKPPGPLYHALIIRGYTKNGLIITNDPGTYKGKNFLYAPDVLYNAIHEWDANNILDGKKVMIVVSGGG